MRTDPGAVCLFTEQELRGKLDCQFSRELSLRLILDYDLEDVNSAMVDEDEPRQGSGPWMLFSPTSCTRGRRSTWGTPTTSRTSRSYPGRVNCHSREVAQPLRRASAIREGQLPVPSVIRYLFHL